MALLEQVPDRGARRRSWSRTSASRSSAGATTCRTAVLREIDENIRLSRDNTGMVAVPGHQLRRPHRAGRRRAQLGPAGPATARSTRTTSTRTPISDALYTAGMPDPDLLIRTAGEMRVSNFLLWQISYAELWVTEKCWPDFDAADVAPGPARLRRRERRGMSLWRRSSRAKDSMG